MFLIQQQCQPTGSLHLKVSQMLLQINSQNLKDRDRWASGWLQKSEIEALNDPAATCQVCAGTGRMVCPLCKDAAVVVM